MTSGFNLNANLANDENAEPFLWTHVKKSKDFLSLFNEKFLEEVFQNYVTLETVALKKVHGQVYLRHRRSLSNDLGLQIRLKVHLY